MGVEGRGVVAVASPAAASRSGRRRSSIRVRSAAAAATCLAGDQRCAARRIMGEHPRRHFAEYIAMPSGVLLPLADDADLEKRRPLMVGHLTRGACCTASAHCSPARRCSSSHRRRVALAAQQLALLTGARVIVTSSSDDKIGAPSSSAHRPRVNSRKEKVAARCAGTHDGEGVRHGDRQQREASWAESLRSCDAAAGSSPAARRRARPAGRDPAPVHRQWRSTAPPAAASTNFASCWRCTRAAGCTPVIDRRCRSNRITKPSTSRTRRAFGKVLVTVP